MWGWIFAILAVIYAAFLIWLTVRIVNRREGWAKWTVLASTCLPLLYVLSVGPMYWLSTRDLMPASAEKPLGILYFPLEKLPQQIKDGLFWYQELWGK